MANSISFGGLSNNNNSVLQTGLGSFVSPAVASAMQGGQTGYLLNPNSTVSSEYNQPPPGDISSSGDAALVEGAASVKAALQNATQSIDTSYNTASNTVGSQELAQQIGATQFLSGNTDLNSLNPFVTAGTAASSQLSALLGNNGADQQTAAISALQNSPGFQFTLQQGTKALQNSAAAKGLLNSGAAAKELTDYAQGQAETLINQQSQNLLNVAQLGETAATTKAGIASSVTQQQANIQSALSQQQAALQAQQGQSDSANQATFSGQLSALQSQLSSQQQNLAIARAQLATQNNQYQTSTALAAQQAAMNNPVAQQLIAGVNNIKGLLASPQISSSLNVQQAQAELASNIAQLKKMGITGY